MVLRYTASFQAEDSDQLATSPHVEEKPRPLATVAITNSLALEPEGSSPHSQKPASGPYPEPTGSNLHSPSQSP
jgi:hypothetical protein